MSLTSARSSETEEFLAAESEPDQDLSARKRMAMGLSPRRPTAKALPQRPPDGDLLSPSTRRALPVLLIAIALATALLIFANLYSSFPAWQPAGSGYANALSGVAGAAAADAAVTYQLRMADNFDGAGSTLAQGDQPGQWRIELIPNTTVYRLEVWPNRIAWSLLGLNDLAPHRLQANGAVVAHTDWGYIGLVDRYQDSNNFYLFVVDGQGRFQIQLHKDGALATQQEWTAVDYLNPAGSANLLAIEDDGQSLRFYGNQMLLYEIAAPELPPGDAGLIAGAQNTGVAEIHFDWFQLFDLLPAPTASP